MAVVAFATITFGHASAARADAILRWLPSVDPTIVGYNVYVRTPHSTYGPPHRAGLPARAADGTDTFTLTGLPSAKTLYFAVSGYRADGSESLLSNEIAVGPTDPCMLDACYAPTACSVSPMPDGTSCGPAGADPCATVCGTGVCGGTARAGLATRRLSLVQSTRGVRLGAVGVLVGAGDADFAGSGFSIAVRGSDGTSLFETALAGDAIRTNAGGTSLRYVAPRGTTTGLLRLSLRRSGNDYKLSARAVLPNVTGDQLPDQLAWVVEVGAQCAGDADVSCTRGSGGVSCS